MVNPVTSRRFMYRGIFLLLCAFIIFLKLLPLTTVPGRVPGPDLLFCLTAVWLMRRPRWAPVGLILLVHIIADILFMRPIGLWSAITLLGYEFLRGKALGDTEITPMVELGITSSLFVLMVIGNTAILAVSGVIQPSLGVTGLHVIMTIIAYPFVMLFCVHTLKVRRARPSDLDGTGVAI